MFYDDKFGVLSRENILTISFKSRNIQPIIALQYLYNITYNIRTNKELTGFVYDISPWELDYAYEGDSYNEPNTEFKSILILEGSRKEKILLDSYISDYLNITLYFPKDIINKSLEIILEYFTKKKYLDSYHIYEDIPEPRECVKKTIRIMDKLIPNKIQDEFYNIKLR